MRLFPLAVPVALAALAVSADAHADSIIKNPGDHPDYSVELEPHGLLGWSSLYVDNGLGLGLRASIPLMRNGFVSSINNSVAISFGLDWLRYDGCYYFDNRGNHRLGCGASFFLFPVTMQWNFWLTEHWSVFGEPGLYIYHGVFDDNYCAGLPNCGYARRTSADFAFYLGGRFHFNDKVSLTMRVGYPSISIGVSFFL